MHSKRKEIVADLICWQDDKPRSMAGSMLKVNNRRQFKSELKSTIPAEWIVEQMKKARHSNWK